MSSNKAKDPIFSRRLRERREKMHLSQNQLSAAARMAQSAINMLEAGARAPSGSTLRALARALGTTTDHLLGASDGEQKARDPGLQRLLNAADGLGGGDMEILVALARLLKRRK